MYILSFNFVYFGNLILSAKYLPIFSLQLLQVPNVKNAERVTCFTQFYILGLRSSHLIYISNDWFSCSLSLLTHKFFTAEIWNKKVYYGYCKGHITIKSPWIKETCKSVTYMYPVSVTGFNRQKYFPLKQCQLVNLSKNCCVLSTSSRDSTISKCLFRF